MNKTEIQFQFSMICGYKTYEILVTKHKVTSKSIKHRILFLIIHKCFFCSTKYISDSGRLSFHRATAINLTYWETAALSWLWTMQ